MWGRAVMQVCQRVHADIQCRRIPGPDLPCCATLCCATVVLQLPGVQSVSVNLLLNSAMVTLDASGTTGPRDVIEAIDDAGMC
jgi:hypothetical protein